ncbi:peptidase T [[Haemophilus] felis]|nr:peptidase T [[Haemophilus] felis]
MLNDNQQYRLLERFLHYTTIDTQAKAGATLSPSSSGQIKLAKLLKQELFALGLEEIEISKHAVVTAFLPSNINPNMPTIGFIAHLDTAIQCSGKNVKAEVIENYRGGDIALGIGEEFISPAHYQFLHKLIGQTLIVADGTTLLGADNKAGIAEIISALAYLKETNLPHCNIRVAFTPDEEIGLGMQFFPLDKFTCDWAYTVDGGALGELEYENFNAATAVVSIEGKNMHIGYAKNKLVNALSLACAFQQYFPEAETPEHSENKQGFYHLASFNGTVEKVELTYLLRDFDKNGLAERKQFMRDAVEKLNTQYNLHKPASVSITDSYSNMYDTVKKVPKSIMLADKAMEKAGIQAIHKAIRGGTDGAWLAEHGLACPNIFTGGYNFHSKHELISLQSMKSAVEVIVNITNLALNK